MILARIEPTPLKPKLSEFEDPIFSSSFREPFYEKRTSPQASTSGSLSEENGTHSAAQSPMKQSPQQVAVRRKTPIDVAEDSDSGDDLLPDITSLIKNNLSRKDHERAKERLTLAKEKAVKQPTLAEDDSDSDGLEIVEPSTSRTDSDPRAVLLKASKRDVRSKAPTGSSNAEQKHDISLVDMNVAGRPLFQQGSSRGAKGDHSRIRQKEMDEFARKRAVEQAHAVTGKKEQEWIERGGHLKRQTETPLALEDVSEKVKALLKDDAEADDEDEDDADWNPEKEDEGRDSDHEDAENGALQLSSGIDDDEADDDKENQPVHSSTLADDDDDGDIRDDALPVRRTHGMPKIVDSDDEEQENEIPPSTILVPDTSMEQDTDTEDAFVLGEPTDL